MPNKVLLKKSSVAAKVPLATDLDYGELALNYTDGKLYYKTATNTIGAFATGTVTSVSGTGTVSGLTLTGTVTGSGNLTLGGTLSLTSGQVTTALGFTPYNATNPSGYITSAALSPYAPLASPALTGAPTAPTAASSISSAQIATTAYVKTLFSSASTSGTLDWNDISNTRPGVGPTLLTGNATNGPVASGAYFHPLNIGYAGTAGTGNLTQLAVSYSAQGNELYMRGRYSDTWGSWIRFLNSGNFNTFSPTLTGTGASGTWGISVTGNAATATKLATARTINGVSFDGTANINIATKLVVLSRAAAQVNVSIANAILAITNRSGSIINVSVS